MWIFLRAYSFFLKKKKLILCSISLTVCGMLKVENHCKYEWAQTFRVYVRVIKYIDFFFMVRGGEIKKKNRKIFNFLASQKMCSIFMNCLMLRVSNSPKCCSQSDREIFFSRHLLHSTSGNFCTFPLLRFFGWFKEQFVHSSNLTLFSLAFTKFSFL